MGPPVQAAGVCPLPPPSVGACYRNCDQCPETQAAWEMSTFPPFAGLAPANLVADTDCVWTSQCYLACDQCKGGMPRAWYVQLLDTVGPLTPAVLIPQGGCRFSSCCPVSKTVVP